MGASHVPPWINLHLIWAHRRRSCHCFNGFLTTILYGFGKERTTPVPWVPGSKNNRKYCQPPTQLKNKQHHNGEHFPLPQCGIYGSAQSDTGNLFRRGPLRALCLGFIKFGIIKALLIYFYSYLCFQQPNFNNGGQRGIYCWRWEPKHYESTNNILINNNVT